MTAAVLTYNVPILPSPYDATLTNATIPGTSEMATGELNSTSVLNAVTYNWLHNAATANLYLEQQLGLFMPFNPSGGGSLIACPRGGVVSVKDSVTGYTQFYVALANMAIGFADPSTDAAHWGLVNFQNVVNSAQPGEIISWSGATAPTGYLQLPTAQANISRATYSNLFAAIGTQWGTGDGSTTFGMPWAAVGSAILHGITGIGGSQNGAVIAHGHTTVANSTGTSTTGIGNAAISTTNIDHSHNNPVSISGNYPAGGVVASTNQGVATNVSTGAMSANATHSHTDSGHTHPAPSLSIPSLSVNSTGGSVNQAFGTTIMLCVKF